MGERLTTGEICTRSVSFAVRDMPLNEAARLMRENHVGCLVVVDEQAGQRLVVGLLTDRDIVTAVVAAGLDPSVLDVGEVMSTDLVTAREDDSLIDLMRVMRRNGVRRVPVVGGQGELVGLVTLDRRLKTQNFPGKILGYAYFCKPILGSFNPGNDLKDLLEEGEAGLCSFNGDDQKFCADALALTNDHSLRTRLGQNARRLLEEKFSVTSAARQILSHFQNPLPVSTGPTPTGPDGDHGQKWQVAGTKA